MTVPIVAARGLTKNYRNRKVLTGLTFELAEGRLHGLLGRNGTGKSTLLSMLVMSGKGAMNSVASEARFFNQLALTP